MSKLLSLTKFTTTAFTGYNNLLIKYPLRTKILTSACFAGLGDYFCQTLIEGRSSKNPQKPYNYRRTLLMTSMSICYGTPILHYWYNAVFTIADKLVKNKKYLPLVATALDEMIFSPPYYAGWLFTVEFMDKHDNEKCVQNVKEKWWSAVVADWKLWPLATLVNFTFVPHHYRILFVNFVGVFWGVYMSWLQNSGNHGKTVANTSSVVKGQINSGHVKFNA